MFIIVNFGNGPLDRLDQFYVTDDLLQNGPATIPTLEEARKVLAEKVENSGNPLLAVCELLPAVSLQQTQTFVIVNLSHGPADRLDRFYVADNSLEDGPSTIPSLDEARDILAKMAKKYWNPALAIFEIKPAD